MTPKELYEEINTIIESIPKDDTLYKSTEYDKLKKVTRLLYENMDTDEFLLCGDIVLGVINNFVDSRYKASLEQEEG